MDFLSDYSELYLGTDLAENDADGDCVGMEGLLWFGSDKS